VGAFGAEGLSWAAGVGQADLAARGQGPVGLARLLLEQAAAFGCRQERLVDLAVVEGAGGDQVVEVAGRLPQLPVALADGGGGDLGELLGQGRPRIAVSPGDAGGRKLGELSAARAAQERSLAILEEVYGPGHSLVADTLTNLGSVLSKLGELSAARAALEQALAIKEAVYGADRPQLVVVTLDNLGIIFQKLGELGAAQAVRERALAIKVGAGHTTS